MGNSGYAVGWGTLSLVNAGLAQAKGRSGLTWWLLSLPLGPLATALIVVWPAVRDRPGDAASRDGQRNAAPRSRRRDETAGPTRS